MEGGERTCVVNLFYFTFVILLGLFLIYNVFHLKQKTLPNDKNITVNNRNVRAEYIRREPNGTVTRVIETEDIPIENPINSIVKGDMHRAFDPLIEPSRRPPLDQIPPPEMASQLYINTRPYFDIPSVVGVLTKVNDQKKESMDDILQLYGAKDVINNYKYNYYAINKNGVKLEVITNNNTLELNSNDIVKVLDCNYIVTLYPNKFYQYNPYAI